MKSIKDLRENYNLITEKEEHDMNKLTQLVRAGLFDAKKLSALKRAMDKPADKMTAQEKRMMINLLDALMAEVLSDKQVYRKIKQDVMKESVVVDTKDYLSKIDPRVKRYGYSQKEAPSVLLLKRKAIRVFPDGQKVALYYAQAIDKYVSIPYNEIGINEETELNEVSLTGIIRGVIQNLTGSDDNSSNTPASNFDGVAKELKSLSKEKTKLNVGGPKDKDDDGRPDAIRSRTERLNRLANQAMAKDVRESFHNKLEVLREFAPDPKIVNPRKRIKELKDKERLDKKNQRTRPLPRDRKVDVPKEQPKSTPETTTDRAKETVKDTIKSYIGKTITKAAPRVLGPVGALVGMTEPAGSKQERDWELANVERLKKAKQTKVATPPERPIGSLPKAKADAKGTSAFTGMPSKSAPKAAKLPPAPKNPNVGITSISEPSDAPETEAQKKLKVPLLNPAKSPTTGDTPGYKTSSDSAAAGATSFAQPWKGAGNWKQPAAQPSPSKNKPKTDDGGTGRQEPEDKPPRKKPGFKLPKLAPGDVGAKALSAMAPGLKLAISGPKREGDADAIRSRQASIERAALKAQANMRESIELDGNLFELNNNAAQKVTALYESLNKKNKKKMIEMMNESAESLEKVISFAVRQ